MGFPVEDWTMNWPVDVAANVCVVGVAAEADDVGSCCRLARINCRPPIDTMELGVAVTAAPAAEVKRFGRTTD